ncbi:hypothetical protein P3X46_026427 [Hevea brasiliensis]|uniref:Zinc-finger domain-containing protein n=1 Tax=Hevea brasiliensis TaxID=3981 RepID=A0ABQ9KZP4_HEVBR|nr:uncharacterized protein LOC110647928 isoform X2 [Hevea brasiliensis]KAJ9152920.1 hypothetical protein P3X46_026427 [Hevea brasiliensis]
MVSKHRKKADGGSTSENFNRDTNLNINNKNAEGLELEGKGTGGGDPGYEELREQRIKENKERMKKLGIFDLSLKLKSQPRPTKKPTQNVSSQKKPQSTLTLSASPRRSSRLKTLTPVNYSEIFPQKKKGSAKGLEIRLQEGSKPEIYSEEDEKLLGDCQSTWTLFVDGYGKDGKRMYDQEKVESCHQCRQKTHGHHTHCSKCNTGQGQFCGDCLYMRYGENVIEVNENPNWICPVCRGICNCSICRKAKGWAPTGSLFRKVTRLGFKSVAHYLIQTRRSKIHSEYSDVENLQSEGKELPPANQGSQLATHYESLHADEHKNRYPDLEPDGNEVEMEEDKKQVFCSGSSKPVGMNDVFNDSDSDNSVYDVNEPKEDIENMGVDKTGDHDN